MEINITKFFNTAAVREFSGSIAERGENAGKETWANACEEAADEPLLTTPEQLQAMRDHVKGFGSWSDEEIAGWTDVEVNALFIQMIAGDIREVPDMTPQTWDWDLYEEMSQEGIIGSEVFKGDDGEIYYHLGN